MYFSMPDEQQAPPPNMTVAMLGAMSAGGINLADGRNRTRLTRAQREIIDSLPQLFEVATTTGRQPNGREQIEREFLTAFYTATKQQAMLGTFTDVATQTCTRGYSYLFLTQSASLSIEFAAKLLASKNSSVIMAEPFLDYMRGIFDRTRVRYEACGESVIFGPNAAGFIKRSSAKGVFLCTPNNPTGRQMDAEQFKLIAETCKASDKILLLDATFRLFDRRPYDQYKILLDSGVSFMTVEDTGKAFPTEEMKVSILACSKDLYPELLKIYTEILLRAAPVHVLLMTRLLDDAMKKGFANTIWRDLDKNRKNLRNLLQGTCFQPDYHESTINLEWLDITNPNVNADVVANDLRERGLHVLSGAQFGSSGHYDQNNIRLSLSREQEYFARGLAILDGYINEKGLRTAPLAPTVPMQPNAIDLAIGAMIGTPKDGLT